MLMVFEFIRPLYRRPLHLNLYGRLITKPPVHGDFMEATFGSWK